MRTPRIYLVTGFAMILAGLSGCASPNFNYQPTATQVSEPPIGVVSVARVGDKMLVQGQYEEQDAIRLGREVSIGMFGAYTFSPGIYVKQGQGSEGDFFRVGDVQGSGHVSKALLSDPFQAILLEPDGSTICAVTVFNVKACESNIRVERIKIPRSGSNSFQQTLLYNGRIGDKINIGYREFSDNLARPAFNNEVEYDLRESKTIGYKNALIEVIDATNQSIRYIVRQNFNGAAH
jgi:hypothetical protein